MPFTQTSPAAPGTPAPQGLQGPWRRVLYVTLYELVAIAVATAGLGPAGVEGLHIELGLQVRNGHAHGRRHPRKRARGRRKRTPVQHRQNTCTLSEEKAMVAIIKKTETS